MWHVKSRIITHNNIVAPCLSDAPTNGSLSGFSSGRETTVRSGPDDVLEFVAPTEAAVSGVPLVTVCVHGAGAWCE